MMTETIHVIEPTLERESGHYGFVASLCHAGCGNSICLWVSKRADLSLLKNLRVEFRRFFYRRLRRIQAYFLYKKLLGLPGRLFVATAGQVDLVLLNWAARQQIPHSKVYLYFHWVRPTPSKLANFRKIAQAHPNIIILGPTPSVVSIFRECGFENARVVPVPINPDVGLKPPQQQPFKHIFFPGAARHDKGFSKIVDLVEYLAARGIQIPFSVQLSPDHYDKYDQATRSDIVRLRKIVYPSLRTYPDTMPSTEYAEKFVGAICLQPYSRDDFADRMSSVTLDALSAGCPVITTAGTWMGRIVEKFDAGMTLATLSAEELFLAINSVIKNYDRYQVNALNASKALRQDHSAAHLLSVLTA
jgi:glycosyltransferase involved in cell wall biosynthesis